MAKESRWNVAAALLLKASCGATITPKLAARSAPMFRALLDQRHKNHREACQQYVEAIAYLTERGFGVSKQEDTTEQPLFIKWPYPVLPTSCHDSYTIQIFSATSHLLPTYSVYTSHMQRIYSLHTSYRLPTCSVYTNHLRLV